MKDKKCLVTEARQKCQCDWCKMSRKNDEIILKCIVQEEVRKIFKKVGIIKT